MCFSMWSMCRSLLRRKRSGKKSKPGTTQKSPVNADKLFIFNFKMSNYMFKHFIAGILLIGSCQLLQAQIEYGNNKTAGHYSKIRGINMYYEIYGQGEPLLFIHGNGGSIQSFRSNIPYFAKQYK